MPIYTLQGADGKTYDVEGPAGATAEQLGAFLSSSGSRALQKRTPDALDRIDPTEGMSGFEKFAAGAGKAIADVGRGAGQLVGLVSKDDVADARKRDEALMRTGAGLSGNIVGNTAMVLPTAFIPGVNTITGGAAAGAALGALQPRTGDDSLVGNMAAGGVLGGALPAVGAAYRAGKAGLYDPLVNQKKILAGALRRSAGNVVAPSVQARTPGVRLSAGASTGNEGLSALEDAIISQRPQGALAGHGQANRTALSDALRGIAGTDEGMAQALARREADAGALYDAARLKGINISSMTPEDQAIMASLSQRMPEEAVSKARELARVSGMTMDDDTSLQGMHWAKKALDSKISTAKRAGDTDTARAYISLRDDLVSGISRVSPEYAKGASLYKELSAPINQMDVGKSLVNKLVPSVSGDAPASLNYASFANSMRDPDALARSATGFQGAKMSSVLSPEQFGTVGGVGADVSAIAEALKRGAGSGSPTARRLAQGNMLSEHFKENAPVAARVAEVASRIPGLNVLTKGLGAFGDIAGQSVSNKMLSDLDELLATNPQLVADMIRGAQPLQASRAMEISRNVPSVLSLSSVPSFTKQ